MCATCSKLPTTIDVNVSELPPNAMPTTTTTNMLTQATDWKGMEEYEEHGTNIGW